MIGCAKCGHAYEEEWPKGKSALCCGNEESGPWRGRVTELFRIGHIVEIARRPPPAWCPLRK